MVFYFKARPEAGDYTIFMGLDKHENEELIKYGFLEDIWFHVDKMSSAHVYLRMRKGQTIDDISEGNKVNNIDVVYTPWANLKKTASMDVGQVGFHNSKMVRTVRVEKRINEIVNRLNKTKVERKPDLKAEREAVNAAERAERKLHLRDKVLSHSEFDEYRMATSYPLYLDHVSASLVSRKPVIELTSQCSDLL
ncbi:hypothetical protein OIU78_002004 [Salix suchowensis]|nr:hypothetical protein OIU78_002004 [Salix suchowensis]